MQRNHEGSSEEVPRIPFEAHTHSRPTVDAELPLSSSISVVERDDSVRRLEGSLSSLDEKSGTAGRELGDSDSTRSNFPWRMKGPILILVLLLNRKLHWS